jgi:hypothetical protein
MGVDRSDKTFDRPLDSGSYTSHEMKDYRNYSKKQQYVDEESCDMKDEKSAEPQQKQDNSKS